MQGAKDESGRRHYEEDSTFKHRLEAAGVAVLNGESIADLRVGTERVLSGKPAQEPVRDIAPPQGTPQERAAAEISQRLAVGDYIAPGETTAETYRQLTGG